MPYLNEQRNQTLKVLVDSKTNKYNDIDIKCKTTDMTCSKKNLINVPLTSYDACMTENMLEPPPKVDNTRISKVKKNVRLAYMNIRGLHENKMQEAEMIELIQSNDILCFVETHIADAFLVPDIDDFTHFSSNFA